MKFVDVKNDVAFRKIFGNENKPEIIISFLNALLALSEEKLIKEVSFESPYLMPNVHGQKSSILDVRVTDARGISYIVEMQVEHKTGFDKRVQYYAAKKYSNQIKKAQDYPLLNQVIFIGILDFNFFADTDDYISRHKTVNVETHRSTLNHLEYNFIELKKFNKKLEEISTLVDKWVYFIKHAENLEIIPPDVQDTGLKEAYEDAAKYNWTVEELEAYDYQGIRIQDVRGELQYKYEKGIEEGIEKGIEQEKKRSKTIIQQAELNSTILNLYFIQKKNVDEIMEITAQNHEYVKSLLSL